MTEEKDKDTKKPLGLKKKLELKKSVETGKIKQSFSHGRSKSVTVEVKRKRVIGINKPTVEKKEEEKAAPVEEKPTFKTAGKEEQKFTSEEMEVRRKALEGAKKAEEERKVREAEKAEEQKLQKEEEERLAAEEKVRREEEEKAAKILAAEEAQKASKVVKEEPKEHSKAAPEDEYDELGQPKKRGKDLLDEEAEKKKKKASSSKGEKKSLSLRREDNRFQGRLNLEQLLADDEREERVRSLTSVRRKKEKEAGQDKPVKKAVREVVLPETITVQELANRLAERSNEVIKKLMGMGVMATINQSIDADTAELIVAEFGMAVKRVAESDVESSLDLDEDALETLKSRPPVVTVMGHVDHGKTSLLDAVRKTDVVSGEAGGITQHIGAYQVSLPDGQKVTFIDTPGHAAFTEMRVRGANATDIVLLVVAADDGLKEQTIEAINHARAAEVPIIVVINKIDKPGADPAKVKQELLSHEIIVEDMSGDVLCVEISAKQGTNIDKLLETVILQSEILELKANPDATARGIVIESEMVQGKGPVATVLVQRGTLKVGDPFVVGAESGRVRALVDEHGNKVEEAGPSKPVEVLGLDGTPQAGDQFVVSDSESQAREISKYRQRVARDKTAALANKTTIENLFSGIQDSTVKELPILLKSDVQGSIEAITSSLEKLPADEVRVKVVHSAVGGINETDVNLARAAGAIVVGFNVRANSQARELAESEKVSIKYYSIIYEILDDLKAMLSGMLTPEVKETFIGKAEVREVFSVSKVGKIAGCFVTEGMVKRGSKVRLLRDDVVIHEGMLKTLKRFKDEVKEVRSGYECGMAFENYSDIHQKDVIECFEIEEISRTL